MATPEVFSFVATSLHCNSLADHRCPFSQLDESLLAPVSAASVGLNGLFGFVFSVDRLFLALHSRPFRGYFLFVSI